MASRTIPDQRIAQLNDLDASDGDYTLYWMQQSQRAEMNHALEFAIQRANEHQSRLLVCFGIADEYPDANRRHFQFMLQGLSEVTKSLSRRGVKFVMQSGSPPEVALSLGKEANEIICDRGYLKHQVSWRDRVAQDAKCRVWEVESDAIVPVEVASDKQEYAARTIRSQINEAAKEFYVDLDTTPLDKHSLGLRVESIDPSDVEAVLDRLSIDNSVRPVEAFNGGTAQAKAKLRRFLDDKLGEYADRTEVIDSNVSFLSPYLHFGQISPLAIANAVRSKRGYSSETKDSFLEELLVRRELAINFVHYCRDYDSLKCLPDWAAKSLNKHEVDKREYHYTATQLEAAETHDAAWNAAMLEMKYRGYLHNHLRMYWGKKIIEWTNTYDHAYRTTLELNNKYFLDGRDANSYTNVAWLFGLHDRAHQEREIFGKVRYMSAEGLRRKIDVDAYVASIEAEIGG